jgi:hypothetical protein
MYLNGEVDMFNLNPEEAKKASHEVQKQCGNKRCWVCKEPL